MSKSETLAKKPELHDVVLLKDHTHQGEKCRAGSTIRVSFTDKNWLKAQHIIAPDDTTTV